MRFFGSKGVRFSENSMKCCICFIDLVDSTKNTLKFSNSKDTRGYYSTFINAIYEIVKKNNAKVVKNIGDSLLFYFPNTSDTTNISSFEKVIECGLEILENRENINQKLSNENFPPFNYRISIDYGVVELALSGEYNQLDIFGSAVNLCAKINVLSKPNELVIGDNFYRMLKAYSTFFEKYYLFDLSGEFKILEDATYSGYVIKKKFIADTLPKGQDISYISNDRTAFADSISLNKDQIEQETMRRIYNNKKKIILIDDDPDVLYSLELFLSECKYNVISFTDCRYALEYIRSNPFYHNLLIISDIRFKKFNGLQLYLQIKSIDPTIKFLFITALDIVDEVTSLVPGLDKSHIIRKPIEKNIFVDKIKTLLPI
ncbi:MAG TPA: adenylate/guanylate cyclase domain-containing protein [Nitrososphaeraceae archaeon]|nr:adenylate/guanylate cyclase domain-containing protein [Nitrososphaeraceae archaeon]